MAKLIQIGTLAGHGYMGRGRKKEPLPTDAIRGQYYHYNDCADPVEIGRQGYVIEQADLTEYRQRTGRLPAKLYIMDYSGSYVYMYEIEWTKEECEAAQVDYTATGG